MNGFGAMMVAMLAGAVSLVLPASAAPGQAADGEATADAQAPPPGGRVTQEGWFAPIEPQFPKPDIPARVTKAFVIAIKGPITPTTYDLIRRKAVTCKANAELVIFEMDTPGGQADSMREIIRLILNDLRDVYTVAYVSPDAFSAGALIALACDEIVVAPMAKIGAAMPIYIGPGGVVELPEKVRGKFESGDRAEIRALAKRNGYNVALCEGMITLEIEIWLIRNRNTQELRIADAADWQGKVIGAPGADTPQEKSSVKAPAPAPRQTEWEYVRRLDGPKELVTLTADEAVFAGLARHVLASMADLKKHYNIVGEPVVLEDNWSEKLVGFLTSPYVMSFLFFVAVLCAYIEINTPGFGIPGSIAIVCFAIIFGSRFLVGLANWWEIGIFVVGLALIAVEVFLIPGFGITGVLGILCCIVGLFTMLIPNAPDKWPIPKTNLDWSILEQGLFGLGAGLLGAIVVGLAVSRFLPKVPGARRLVLEAARTVSEAPVTEESPMRRVSIGDIGAVESMCRPVGKARFGGDLLDAASEGGVIEAGSRVRVLRRDGNRLIVEKVEQG